MDTYVVRLWWPASSDDVLQGVVEHIGGLSVRFVGADELVAILMESAPVGDRQVLPAADQPPSR